MLPLDEARRETLIALPWPTKLIPQISGHGTATLRAFVREHLFVAVFRACAESLASESASRLAAMERADKNIDALLEGLSSQFRRIRKNGIDAELFDVVAGFGALVKAPPAARPASKP